MAAASIASIRNLSRKKAGVAWLVDERWLVAQPARGFTAVTGLIAGPERNGPCVLATRTRRKAQTACSQIDRAMSLKIVSFLPGPPLAGPPIVSGNFLILPLATARSRRLSITELAAEPEPGPSWRADRLPASTCFLAPINDDELSPPTALAGCALALVVDIRSSLRCMAGCNWQNALPRLPALFPARPPLVVVVDSNGQSDHVGRRKARAPNVEGLANRSKIPLCRPAPIAKGCAWRPIRRRTS